MDDVEVAAPRPDGADRKLESPSAAKSPEHYGPELLDWLLMFLLFSASCALSWVASHRLEPEIGDIDDLWFQSDTGRVLKDMTQAGSDHYRSKVHPIFVLASYSFVQTLRSVWPGSDFDAALRMQSLVAGLWTAAFYWLCRLLRQGRVAAWLFSLLGATSAAFVYWFAVPETYGWGSLALIAALITAAIAARREVSNASLVAVSAATLSMTVTNWMAGLALVGFTRPRRMAIRLSALALVAVVCLALVQKLFFPSATLFFLGSAEELNYLATRQAGPPHARLYTLLFHVLTMPAQRLLPGEAPMLSVQGALPGSASIFGAIATVLWTLLLAMGTWRLVQTLRGRDDAERGMQIYARVLASLLVGQMLLHLVYGEETFLYALHLLPPLLGLALFSLNTKARPLALALAAGLLACNSLNNWNAFEAARRTTFASLSPRLQVRRAMRLRPEQSFPRGNGHVLVGPVGGSLETKGYQEPGGSFSPAPGSFGISIWITDQQGKTVATSDTVPWSALRQSFGEESAPGVPSLRTETPFYTASWSTLERGFRLELEVASLGAGHSCWLVVRSVGPAGGPLTRAAWHGDTLQLNDRHRVVLGAPARTTLIGNETRGGVRLVSGGAQSASDADGWLYGAAKLDNSRLVADVFVDAPRASTAPRDVVAPLLRPVLPDTAFAASLYAQQVHLLASLVGAQTRPGDPLNYGFDWLRDGGYVTVALARAGQLEVARKLLGGLAERDFFGGFGPEGDAPGIALWAMGQVSELARDPSLDRELWPHVRRKVRSLEECLEARTAIRKSLEGPVLGPSTRAMFYGRICEPARRGLMVGWADFKHPLLYGNAMAYAGLRAAARMALRLQERTEGERLDARADRLARAWQRLFLQDTGERKREARSALLENWRGKLVCGRRCLREELELEEDWEKARDDVRTRSSGMWPSFVAGSPAVRREYAEELSRPWAEVSTTPRSYFAVAQAHQWLLLGEPERSREALRWLGEHSSSPGLYTWSEGTGEENAGPVWQNVRGWVNPAGVTPHYRTAAEVLLLQLDMLAYVDDAAPDRPIVIGAGIPASWLTQPFEVGPIGTSRGFVGYSVRAGAVEVRVPSGVPFELAGSLSSLRLATRDAATQLPVAIAP